MFTHDTLSEQLKLDISDQFNEDDLRRLITHMNSPESQES